MQIEVTKPIILDMTQQVRYTPELGQEIADLIAQDFTLREIADMPGMPPRSTISEWAVRHDDFSDKCARARQQQAHVIVESMKETLEEVHSGAISPEQGRVLISGKQWIASKKNPKTYGDKMTLAGDADNPLFSLGKRLDAIQEAERKMIDITPDQLPGSELC